MKDRSKKFEDLVVWRKAHQFVLAVYRLTHRWLKKWVNYWKLTCGLFWILTP